MKRKINPKRLAQIFGSKIRKNSSGSQQRIVLLRSPEVKMLIEAYRQQSNQCRLMLMATTDVKTMNKLREKALRCENRAAELAQ